MKGVFLLSLLTSTIGVQQMIRFVSWINSTASSNQAQLIILNSAPNINTLHETYEELVFKATYITFTGWWALFGGAAENYTGESWNTLYKDDPIEVPAGTLASYFQSIRHLGPPDTDTVSVSCYSGVGFGGRGELIETEGDIPFEVESLFFTGNGTWNFYPGLDQGGNPVTYTASAPFRNHSSKADWPGVLQGKVIKSIRRMA